MIIYINSMISYKWFVIKLCLFSIFFLFFVVIAVVFKLQEEEYEPEEEVGLVLFFV